MEYRNLGNSGLQVSLVGLGCNNFGRRLDAAGTKAVVDKCIDMGITFFDTADVYGGRGKSEEFLAPALKPHRRDIVIATKSASPMGEGPYWRGASRKYLMDAVDACLSRLDTDYIDLYQMHIPDPSTPIEETLRALDDIVRSGKVRYIGNSNYAGWQVVESAWVAKTEHLTPFISAQNQYNLLERNIETRAGARRTKVRPQHPALLPARQRLPHRQVPPRRARARRHPPRRHGPHGRPHPQREELRHLDEARRRRPTLAATRWSTWRLAGWRRSPSSAASSPAPPGPSRWSRTPRPPNTSSIPDEMKEIDEILGVNQGQRR